MKRLILPTIMSVASLFGQEPADSDEEKLYTTKEYLVESANSLFPAHFKELGERADTTVTKKTISRTLPINGKEVTFSLSRDKYTQLVHNGIIAHTDTTAVNRIMETDALKSFAEDDTQLTPIINALKPSVAKVNGETLEKRLQGTDVVIDTVEPLATYLQDSPLEKNGFPTTKYMEKVDAFYVDIYKALSVFLIDGGGDCEDYAITTVKILNECEINARMVHIIYESLDAQNHAVIAIEIPPQTRESLIEYLVPNTKKTIYTDFFKPRSIMTPYKHETEWNEELDHNLITFEMDDKLYLAIEPQKRPNNESQIFIPDEQEFELKVFDNKTG